VREKILDKALDIAIADEGYSDECVLGVHEIMPPWCDCDDNGVCVYKDRYCHAQNGGFPACWKRWFIYKAKLELEEK